METTKQGISKKRLLSIFTGIFLIAILSGSIGYSIAVTGWTPPNIALDDFPSTASFVIKADTRTTPTTYYAVASNGSICWSSTNASYIIQTALNFASNGTVLLKNGDYYCDTTIYQETAGLVGESKGATLIFTTDTNGIQLMASDTTAFSPKELSTLTLRSSSTNFNNSLLTIRVDNVLEFSSDFPIRVNNLDIYRSTSLAHTGIGISIIATEADAGVAYQSFSNIYLHGLAVGIYLQTTYNSSFISYCSFNNIVFDWCVEGIKIYDTESAGSGVHNCYFSNMRMQARDFTTYFIYSSGGKRNIFHECAVTDLEPTAYSLSIVGTAANNVFELGSFPQTGSITGFDTLFNNVRYIVTKNSGNELVVNGSWIAHGLSIKPNYVSAQLFFNDYLTASSFILQPSVLSVNNTHFQISLIKYSNSSGIEPINVVKNVYWAAEYNDLDGYPP